MSRSENESVADYKKRVLDSISPSYCGAKWYFSTIWLGNGQTASCHHPPPHRISVEEIKNNPSALHNTRHKKLMRAQMLQGERPRECEYCWKIEDMTANGVSDRIHKTEFFNDADHIEAKTKSWNENFPVRHLEIAFDRKCNLACSYCNAGYSSRWGEDIVKNGPYQNLRSDGKGAFCHDGRWSDQFENGEENPYISAFWNWWPNLKNELEEFRVTGGEPMMSPHFWKLLEMIRKDGLPEKVLFTINSNLSLPNPSILKLIDFTKSINRFGVYTSCESVGAMAEYIRDGLDYKRYLENIQSIIQAKYLERFQFMVTVNALALYGLTDFLDQVIAWKDPIRRHLPAFGLTILRFPSFMSPSTLPVELKQERASHFEKWLNGNKSLLLPHEFESVQRLVFYLREVEAPHSASSEVEKRQSDFKAFYTQYDRRRGKNFETTFPSILVDWYRSIPTFSARSSQDLLDGNAADNFHDPNELDLLEARFSSR